MLSNAPKIRILRKIPASNCTFIKQLKLKNDGP